MPSAKLSVQLEALLGSSWGNLSKAAQQIQDFEAKAQSAGAALTATFTLPIALLGRAAIKSGAELDGLNRSMIAITGSAEEAGKQTKKLNEIAKLPGLNFKDAVQGFVNLRSAGLSAEIAERALSSFGNALGILGKTGGLGNVNAQIQQMATKTQGFGADLKILKEWVPQVSVALQSAFGTTNADMIEKMGNTGKEVVTKLIAELEKLPKATGGLGNSLENLDDSWFKFTASMGLAIEKAFDLSGKINSLSDGLTNLSKWFEELDPFWQKTIFGIMGVTAISGPLLFALGQMPGLFKAIGVGAKILFAGPVLEAFAIVAAAFVTAKIAQDIYANGWDSFWDRLTNKAETASLRIKIALLKIVNIGGSGDFALGQAQSKLLNLLHDSDTPFNIIGNSQFNKKATPKTPTGPKTPIGPQGEKKTDYYAEYLNETALNKIKDAHDKLAKEDEAFFKKREDLATKHQNFFKNINLVPQDLIGKATAGYDFLGTKTDAFFDRMKKSMEKTKKEIEDGMQKIKEELTPKDITNEGIGNIFTQGATEISTGLASWAGAMAQGIKPMQSLAEQMQNIFSNMLKDLGQFLIKRAIMTGNVWLGVGGLAATFIGGFSQVKPKSTNSTTYNSVSNYQPIYQPTNTGSNGSAGGRVSIEITQNKSVLRGNDLVYLEQKTQYGETRGFGVTKG